MYNYDEVYEKITRNTKSVNLPADESIKIVNKVYKDLEIGLLKPRNITKKTHKLICNSLARQNKQKDTINIDHYRVNSFIDNIKSKLVISDNELRDLEEKLLALEIINDVTLNRAFKRYLKETGNNSLKMIKNQSFRDLDQAIIEVDNIEIAKKYGIYDERLMFYSFIDHDKGLLFELLTEGDNENFILTKNQMENEVIKYIDKEDIEIGDYKDIRKLEMLDKFRDSTNPDIITVMFIDSGKSENLKVKLESVIGSKLIGTLIEKPQLISNVLYGDEVVVTYCYDYTDNIHLYVNGTTNNSVRLLKDISKKLQNPSKEIVSSTLSQYKNSEEFDFIVDTFHSTIFDYYRDLNEFYKEINKEELKCI